MKNIVSTLILTGFIVACAPSFAQADDYYEPKDKVEFRKEVIAMLLQDQLIKSEHTHFTLKLKKKKAKFNGKSLNDALTEKYIAFRNKHYKANSYIMVGNLNYPYH